MTPMDDLTEQAATYQDGVKLGIEEGILKGINYERNVVLGFLAMNVIHFKAVLLPSIRYLSPYAREKQAVGIYTIYCHKGGMRSSFHDL